MLRIQPSSKGSILHYAENKILLNGLIKKYNWIPLGHNEWLMW
jgi:hypothetical protein